MSSYSWLIFALCFGLSLLSTSIATPVDTQIITRHARSAAGAETHADIVRRLSATSSLEKRSTYRTDEKVDLEQSWEDVTLFAIGAKADHGNVSLEASVDISCKTCYIKGRAFAELNIESNLDIPQIFNNTINDVRSQVVDLANRTKEQIEGFIGEKFDSENITSYLKGTYDNLEDGIDVGDFLPSIRNISYDLSISPIPDATLSFRFEDLDVYLELETILNASATYTLPLFHSQTAAGISIAGTKIGATFTVDLILAVEGSLNMTSGLHIKVDDVVSLDIALFGDEVSRIDFNGGQFEFLPVTVQSAEASFTATLRIGAQAGLRAHDPWNFRKDVLHLELPDLMLLGADLTKIEEALDYEFGGGIEVGVYADVASFRTGLKKASTSDDDECDVEVLQEYSFALAATAGAQVTLGTSSYGPSGGATTDVFKTTMASTCVGQSPAITTAPVMTAGTLQKRQDPDDRSTTTIETTIKHVAAQCPPAMSGQCAASEQEFTTSTEILTATVTLTGSEDSVIYPTPTTINAIAFGSNANALPPLAGSPTSYTAQPTGDGFIDQLAEDVKDHKQVAIGAGVGVGVGVPVLAVLAVVIFFCVRRQK